jgi:hypothetical protein
MKKYFSLIFVLLLICISGCKKPTEYNLSPSIREYFTFKPGSFWIYQNDSTGKLDSTSVQNFSNFITDWYEGSTVIAKSEVLVVDFNSSFLKELDVITNSCKQSDYAFLTGKDISGYESDGSTLFYPEWKQDVLLIPECSPGIQYYYKIKSSDTINNQVYHDVLFTEIRSIDSSYQSYHFRRISYSPHIGIIKYYDYFPARNINCSFTLKRCNIIK